MTKGVSAGEAGQRLRPDGERIDQLPRQLQARRAAPGQSGDVGQHRGQEHVLAAEDVALADAPAAQGGEVPGGDVVDVDQVEAGIDEGRHAAGGGLDDDAARSGSVSRRADRSASTG